MQNLATKNQFIYSDRKNTEYKSEEVINIYIPPNMAMVNPKEVFMVFDIKLSSSQYKGVYVRRLVLIVCSETSKSWTALDRLY